MSRNMTDCLLPHHTSADIPCLLKAQRPGSPVHPRLSIMLAHAHEHLRAGSTSCQAGRAPPAQVCVHGALQALGQREAWQRRQVAQQVDAQRDARVHGQPGQLTQVRVRAAAAHHDGPRVAARRRWRGLYLQVPQPRRVRNAHHCQHILPQQRQISLLCTHARRPGGHWHRCSMRACICAAL